MARHKLSLEKETLRRLGDNELARVAGASGRTCDSPTEYCQTNEPSVCYTHCDTETCTDVTCGGPCESFIPPCLPNLTQGC
jgi:hypothetical protein